MNYSVADLGRINDASGHPKFLQIANRLRELIDSGKLGLGDRLPSVNQVIAHFGVSRDTAVKAYQELKNQGIVESTPNKAFFVSNVLLREGLKRVLFLTDAWTPYKERVYSGLLDGLAGDYYVDIVIHNDSFDVLRMAYEKYRAIGSCTSFLIIPTAAQGQEHDYFQYVNPGNLLFLDRRVDGLPHPAVWQDFANGFHSALAAKSERLAKYRRLVFLTKYFTNPIIEEMREGLSRFASECGMGFAHQHTMFSDREIKGSVLPEKGELYVVLDDHLLIEAMTACRERGLKLGSDVGLIAVNDGPFYAHLPTPISVLTADFYAMGLEAARFVTSGETRGSPVATSLIVRESV
ncbi:MAG TPA: GntR family transcriptional regulator [Treponemataceae bacterium]|nr:GntR family transcriptional regulator [Treponemataceae bacterium]